ncbi:MAG: 5-formyltetrahydrofolate cyclo-ligase [Bacteroidales bacterium]|nr:5-formyltetrahydrofolate cyclo-ligase [Bacteroidales bacterium]
MPTLAEEKKLLRQQMRALKHSFTPEQLAEKSKAAIAVLTATPQYVAAKNVMLYYALPDEVDTHALVFEAIKTKRVILPTVVGNDIIPVEVTPSTKWREGDFHIMEPIDAPIYRGDYDLIVVPGMAFDIQGHRCGRGRGYYDRFLLPHPNVATIGICFDFQLVDKVPSEPFDRPVDMVIANPKEKV